MRCTRWPLDVARAWSCALSNTYTNYNEKKTNSKGVSRMKNEVQAWARNLKQVLGTNLTGVILYGSAARGDLVPGHSDLNLMLVFKKIDLGQIAKIKRLRFQLEFELRAKLLKLREDWLAINRDTYAQERYLIKAGTSFEYLIGKAQAVLGKKEVTAPDLFTKIKRLKKKEIRLKRVELQDLFYHLHETVEAVIGKIDAA